ncbi:hypothetical protein HOP50_18g82370 [Chloropicon primus]|uniref:Uncharacterized protein n=1 Tax=Chloropicon primus TaxID=1764295 RepID=A0A5B8N077_9CHLO|nr:hypothetical protein A3770_18p82140 [Chloropicon primus]UPR04892.1 hypothetical protein HOP50_18g82370 [Chloropicon primus]|eukprot:QDZ25696.1 hypothetical protein A3770_18p82140 [Chloropicon primus]
MGDDVSKEGIANVVDEEVFGYHSHTILDAFRQFQEENDKVSKKRCRERVEVEPDATLLPNKKHDVWLASRYVEPKAVNDKSNGAAPPHAGEVAGSTPSFEHNPYSYPESERGLRKILSKTRPLEALASSRLSRIDDLSVEYEKRSRMELETMVKQLVKSSKKWSAAQALRGQSNFCYKRHISAVAQYLGEAEAKILVGKHTDGTNNLYRSCVAMAAWLVGLGYEGFEWSSGEEGFNRLLDSIESGTLNPMPALARLFHRHMLEWPPLELKQVQ